MGRRQFGTIRKLPSGRWQARYRDQAGRSHTAPETFASKADAGRWLSKAETDQSRGQLVDPKLGRIKLSDWIDEYMTGAVHLRATTRYAKTCAFRVHIKPALGHIPLSALTPLDIRRFVERISQNLAPSTVDAVYTVLHAALNAAVDAELIAVTPCRGIKLPPKRPSEKKFLTPEEIDRLAAAMVPEYRPMIYIAAYLGLRWSEVAGLRVKRIDLLRRTMTVAETAAFVGGFADVKSKAGRRTIKMPDFLADMIAAHLAHRGLTAKDGDALLFVAQRGGRLYAANWHKRFWKTAVADSGLAVNYHGLRHTSVGLMVATGTHPKVIQQRLGHSSWSTTMDVYGHVLESVDDGLDEKLQAMFKAASERHGQGTTGAVR